MQENKLQFQQLQSEKLKELGSYLRAFRQQQSLSVEDVAEETRIQARLLNAIEEGSLEQLPEPVYIRAFIKRYANALELDGEEFANDFPTGSSFIFVKPSWRHLPTGQLRPLHLYLLYIVLVIGAVNSLSYLVNRSAIQANNSEFQQPGNQLLNGRKSLRVSQQQLGAPRPSIVTESPPATGDKPVRVGMTLKAQSWIRVVADGKTEFEGVLPEGYQKTWVADEKLIVRAGNAGGVVVAFNNKQAKELGNPGEVQEVIFKVGDQKRS